MIHAAALLTVGVFFLCLWMFRVVAVAGNVTSTSRRALRTIRAANLSDDVKERELQSASLTLLASFCSISLRAAAALAFSLAPVFALQSAGLVTVSEVGGLLATPAMIIATTIVFTAGYFATRLL